MREAIAAAKPKSAATESPAARASERGEIRIQAIIAKHRGIPIFTINESAVPNKEKSTSTKSFSLNNLLVLHWISNFFLA
jgi:hypothetical protein